MSDHLDAPGFKSPRLNAKLDITDIYVFQSPEKTDCSILILNVNPIAPTLADRFDDEALYELKVDNNHDTIEDVTFRFKFSPFIDGNQNVTVYRATGEQATEIKTSGEVLFENYPVCFGSEVKVVVGNGYRLYAGMRSDPFFFDLQGFLDGGKFTGTDTFIDKNVFSVVLEVPNQTLGSSSQIGIWARVLAPEDHTGNEPASQQVVEHSSEVELVQVDQMGQPLTNIIFMEGEDKNLFNLTLPIQQVALFKDKFVATLTKYGRSQADSEGLVEKLLPDLLHYDYSKPAGFPNGRTLPDDIIDAVLSMVNNTPVSDKVKPHTDLLSTFPFLGNPHPFEVASVA